MLDWNPLFSVVKVTPDNSEYLVSNTVTVTVSLLYHGQKVGIHNTIYGEIFKDPKISRFHCNLAELKILILKKKQWLKETTYST